MTEIELLEIIAENQISILDGVLQFQQQTLEMNQTISYLSGVIIALIFVIIFTLTWGSE